MNKEIEILRELKKELFTICRIIETFGRWNRWTNRIVSSSETQE